MLEWVIRAAHESQHTSDVVVATTGDPSDDETAAVALSAGARVFRGDPEDVLSRFVEIANGYPPKTTVVRLTADCPLLDPALIDLAIVAFRASGADYLSTIRPRSLPRGLDVEVMHREALITADRIAHGYHRAHVTPALYENPKLFLVAGVSFEPRADDLRVTVDTESDLELVRRIVSEFDGKRPNWREIVRLLRARPDLVSINQDVEQKRLEEG